MKLTKKEKLKKLGSIIVKGAKESDKFVKKYGPKAHAYFRDVSESTMDVFSTPEGKRMPHLTPKRAPRRMPKKRHAKTKGGFFVELM